MGQYNSDMAKKQLVWPSSRREQFEEESAGEEAMLSAIKEYNLEESETFNADLVSMARNLRQANYEEELPSMLIQIDLLIDELKKSARHHDIKQVDGFSQQLSNFVLLIGAEKMLKAAFYLQNAARCRDYSTILGLVTTLEQEFAQVKQELGKVRNQ
jgi:hypothetical protein